MNNGNFLSSPFVLSPVCCFVLANVHWILIQFSTDGQSLILFGACKHVHISSVSLLLKAIFDTFSQNISSYKRNWQNILFMCKYLILNPYPANV